jgi:hypothetical protein
LNILDEGDSAGPAKIRRKPKAEEKQEEVNPWA